MISLRQQLRDEDSPGTYTFGTGGANPKGRFGGAHPNGSVNLHYWVGSELVSAHRKCSTYRKAQRKLLQWLKGYNV